MIPIETAEKILCDVNCRIETEEVQLMDSLGRVLGQDIISSIFMPPFDKSAMDGYALRSDDKSDGFKIVETIAAGSVPTKNIEPGECAKIMTGAMIPRGADRVVKIEVTEENNGLMSITGEDNYVNICYRGEDIKPGDMILKRGHLIRPPEVGMIASMGLNRVNVSKIPLVGIVTTGSEIVEPGSVLNTGQIFNSNAYSISSQVRYMGARVKYGGIVSDEIDKITALLESLLDQTRMVLISGGVSMGDFDFVPGVLKKLGVNLLFNEVSIQPGKPTVFGVRGDTMVFGLPGNPVSTFTIFEVFVKPMLYKLMGHNYSPTILKGTLRKEFRRKRTERTAFVPVRYENDGFVDVLEYHGSAHLTALSEANAFLKVPVGVDTIPQGSEVYVRQI